MATKKPQRSPAEIEDIILRKIILISLTPPPNPKPNPTVLYLELTATEILSEGHPLLLSRPLSERILIDRLSTDGPDPPFPYLLSCYRRSLDESKKVSSMKDPSLRADIDASVKHARALIISYSRILVGNPDTFPSPGTHPPPSADLLSVIFSEVASSIAGESSLAGTLTAPPGFLDDFFCDADYETVDYIMKDLFERLRMSVERVSALGNFQQPLRALLFLLGFPNCAKALVNHPRWIPREVLLFVGEGRVMEVASVLGCFLHVSALPDIKEFRSQPDVG